MVPSQRDDLLYQRAAIFERLTAFALRELEATVPAAAWRLIGCSARRDLGIHLLLRLDQLLAPAVTVLLQGRLVPATPVPERVLDDESSGCSSNPSALLTLFPAITETLALYLWDWIRAERLFATRLERDAALLTGLRVLSTSAPDSVKAIKGDLSDPHGDGAVMLISFGNRQQIIYKPRGCAGERIWIELLKIFNEEGFRLKFQHPQLQSRGPYHWMSFVRHSPCRGEAAVRRFYCRWGTQTMLATLFGFADLHAENWVSAGEHPVLVDAEVFGLDNKEGMARFALNSNSDPVMATGLLAHQPSHGAGYFGIAPFDSAENFNQLPTSWPRCNGEVRLPKAYGKEIIDGFVGAARFLGECPRAERRVCQLLMHAQRARTRLIFRSTKHYQELLYQSLHPGELICQSSRLPNLRQRCRDAASPEIGEAEARALWRCSMPHFAMRHAAPAHDGEGLGEFRRRLLLAAGGVHFRAQIEAALR